MEERAKGGQAEVPGHSGVKLRSPEQLWRALTLAWLVPHSCRGSVELRGVEQRRPARSFPLNISSCLDVLLGLSQTLFLLR